MATKKVPDTNGMKLSPFSAQVMALRGQKPGSAGPTMPYLHAIRTGPLYTLLRKEVED